MTTLRDVLVRSLEDLCELSISHALIGGLAVSARVEPRTTRDVDLAISVANDSDAELLIHALQRRGYGVHAVIEQTATNRLATARLIPPNVGNSGVVLDLLFASCGVEPEVVAAAEAITIAKGLVSPVARAGHLVALKLLSVGDHRPQDTIDLVALRSVLDDSETALARDACRLIVERGFARGRDLDAALDSLIAPR